MEPVWPFFWCAVCTVGVQQFLCRWEHLQSLWRNSMFILDKNPGKLGTEGLCLSPCSCALCESWLIWVAKWYLVLCRFLTPTFVSRRQWQTFWRSNKPVGSRRACLTFFGLRNRVGGEGVFGCFLVVSCHHPSHYFTGGVPEKAVVQCEFCILINSSFK